MFWTMEAKHFFDEPVKNNLRPNDSIKKFATGQEDYYTTGCLLSYNNWLIDYILKTIIKR